MKHLFRNKKFLSVYLLWVLIHTFLLLQNIGNGYRTEEFWPFSNYGLQVYDVSEWLVYVFSPLLILFLVTSFSDKDAILLLIMVSISFISHAQMDFTQNDISARPVPGSGESPDARVGELIINDPPEPEDQFPKIKRKIKKTQYDPNKDFSEPLNNKYSQYKTLNDWAKAPSSFEARLAPETFNWEATHADRFVHSPCYKDLGFHPTTDPILMQQQEESYERCEDEKRMETVKHVAMVLSLLLAVSGIIFLGVKSSKSHNYAS